MISEPAAAGSLRAAAVALLAGQLVLLVSSGLHPAREHPADHAAVFAEYAADPSWTTVHLVQWLGGIAMFFGLALIAQHIVTSRGRGALPARLAVAAAGLVAAVFTVLQAVDGVALKMAVDAWAGADPGGSSAGFSAAEAIRWTEISLNAVGKILQGVVVGLVALAAVASGLHGRWLAALGFAAGVGGVAAGVATGYTGFSTLVAAVGMGPMFLQMFWTVSLGVRAWRRGRGVAR